MASCTSTPTATALGTTARPVWPAVRVSDGVVATTTAADGTYSLTISTDRRTTDIVWASQPRGYRFGLDQFKEPRFWANLGQLGDGATPAADFALERDRISDGDNFSWANIADPHVNAQLPDQIREINSTGTDLRFIAVSGDLTNNASQAQFNTYRNSTAQSNVGVWPHGRQPRVRQRLGVRGQD